jgi:hypothetical protein
MDMGVAPDHWAFKGRWRLVHKQSRQLQARQCLRPEHILQGRFGKFLIMSTQSRRAQIIDPKLHLRPPEPVQTDFVPGSGNKS